MRIALAIEYDGSGFCGWQSQDQVRTVQGCVEEAISKVANESIQVVCAGRTDTGVHATAQIIHFDTNASRSERSWVLGTNANLPPDIAVRWAKSVNEEFHARFKANERSYRYIIMNSETRSALLRSRVCWDHHDLDHEAMAMAARSLLGEHDFTSFRAAGCQARHAVREITKFDIQRSGSFVYLDITANAFLQHMVRNIAGVLMAIGRGEQSVAWAGELLQARDRTVGGVTASPQGLYLVGVRYPQSFCLPEDFLIPQLS